VPHEKVRVAGRQHIRRPFNSSSRHYNRARCKACFRNGYQLCAHTHVASWSIARSPSPACSVPRGHRSRVKRRAVLAVVVAVLVDCDGDEKPLRTLHVKSRTRSYLPSTAHHQSLQAAAFHNFMIGTSSRVFDPSPSAPAQYLTIPSCRPPLNLRAARIHTTGQ